MRILVVDDSLVMRRIIAGHLKSMGYDLIEEAEDGRRALRILREKPVGLIISDWCMNGMHGLELLKRVRADQELKDLPFIMVTAEAQEHLVRQAIEAKVSRYVTKPFTRQRFVGNIRQVLAGRESESLA